MKNRGKRLLYFLSSSLLILLVGGLFVFGTSKPRALYFAPKVQLTVPDREDSFNTVHKIQEEDSFHITIYDSLHLAAKGLTKLAFDYALQGYDRLNKLGDISNRSVISIADFSRSSCIKRFFVIDLKKRKLLFNTYVAHGINSGQEYARRFSNIPESNQSSLGFYRTSATYSGKHGYSLHLEGLEKGINDNAYKRDIVLHGADYVSEASIQAMGYIGRSQGCPAVPQRLHKQIIDKIKNGTCLFIYGNDRQYLRRSSLLPKDSSFFTTR